MKSTFFALALSFALDAPYSRVSDDQPIRMQQLERWMFLQPLVRPTPRTLVCSPFRAHTVPSYDSSGIRTRYIPYRYDTGSELCRMTRGANNSGTATTALAENTLFQTSNITMSMMISVAGRRFTTAAFAKQHTLYSLTSVSGTVSGSRAMSSNAKQDNILPVSQSV
jgi:hypothetical protein